MVVTGEVLLQVFTQVSERLQLKTTDETLHDDNTTKQYQFLKQSIQQIKLNNENQKQIHNGNSLFLIIRSDE